MVTKAVVHTSLASQHKSSGRRCSELLDLRKLRYGEDSMSFGVMVGSSVTVVRFLITRFDG